VIYPAVVNRNLEGTMMFLALVVRLETKATARFKPPARPYSSVKSPPPPPTLHRTTTQHLVLSRNDLEACINELVEAESFVFDTETNGLNVRESFPIGVGFSTESKSFYVPLCDSHLKPHSSLAKRDVIQSIKVLFDTTHENLKIAHNVKFDMQMLKNIGVSVSGNIFDTMIAGFLLDSSKPYNLDAMSMEHLNFAKIPTSELIGKGKKQTTMDQVDLQQVFAYCCEDVSCTFQLYQRLHPRLEEDSLLKRFFYDHEMKICKVLAKMEQAGINVDRGILTQIQTEITCELSKIKSSIFDLGLFLIFTIESTIKLILFYTQPRGSLI
jgi:DNA polymerase-1